MSCFFFTKQLRSFLANKRREKAKLQRFTNFTPPGRDTFRGYCVTWSRKQPPGPRGTQVKEFRTAHCGFTHVGLPPCGNGVIICYFWLGAPQHHPKTATQALRFGKWKANKPHQTPCSHIFASNHFPNNGESDLPRHIGTSTTRHLWAAYSWGCFNHSYGGFPTSGGPCLDIY